MVIVCPECNSIRVPCEYCGNSGWGEEIQKIQETVLNNSIVGKVNEEIQTESIKNAIHDIYIYIYI